MIAVADKKHKIITLTLDDTVENRELLKRLNIAAIKRDVTRRELLTEILRGCFTRKRENGEVS